jgi:hypothetical protein
MQRMSNFDNNWRPTRRDSASSDLANRADELRASLRPLDPDLVAARSGVNYLLLGPERGELHFLFWGKLVKLTWPELAAYDHTDDALPAFHQALFLYYLLTANGTPLSGRWVSFADLPEGRMYNAAFQGYTGDEISKTFGLQIEDFNRACKQADGHSLELGDAAYRFQALPRLELLAVYHLGDEDFPSSCKVLFDGSATHYLPIDGCAILGSLLTRKILAAHNSESV